MVNRPGPRRCGVGELTRLLNDVIDARTEFGRGRSSGLKSSPQVPSSQTALLAALEDYAAALASAGRPLPYRLRDELHLHRKLTGSDRASSFDR